MIAVVAVVRVVAVVAVDTVVAVGGHRHPSICGGDVLSALLEVRRDVEVWKLAWCCTGSSAAGFHSEISIYLQTTE